MEQDKGIIDFEVTFSVYNGETEKGIVIDKILMLNKKPRDRDEDDQVHNRVAKETDYSIVTGYLIRTDKGKVHPVQYWRILKVRPLSLLDDDDEREENNVPKRDVPGGYKRRQAIVTL